MAAAVDGLEPSLTKVNSLPLYLAELHRRSAHLGNRTLPSVRDACLVTCLFLQLQREPEDTNVIGLRLLTRCQHRGRTPQSGLPMPFQVGFRMPLPPRTTPRACGGGARKMFHGCCFVVLLSNASLHQVASAGISSALTARWSKGVRVSLHPCRALQRRPVQSVHRTAFDTHPDRC